MECWVKLEILSACSAWLVTLERECWVKLEILSACSVWLVTLEMECWVKLEILSACSVWLVTLDLFNAESSPEALPLCQGPRCQAARREGDYD